MYKKGYKIGLVAIVVATLCFAAGCAPSQSNTSSENNSQSQMVDNSVYDAYTYSDHEQLVADTSYLDTNLGYNPHDSHFNEIATCQTCHDDGTDQGNRQWCTSCHIGMDIPDGWQNVSVVPTTGA